MSITYFKSLFKSRTAVWHIIKLLLYSKSVNRHIELCLAAFSFTVGWMGPLTELLSLSDHFSLNKLLSHGFSWRGLSCSPWNICPDSVGILSSLFFKAQSSYCQCQMAGVPRGPWRLQHNRNPNRPPFPLPSPLRISPHQGWRQRNPPTSPPSITTPFVQAVTTCKAFPQAEHMGLINCRSLTTLSCPNPDFMFHHGLCSSRHIPASLPAWF